MSRLIPFLPAVFADETQKYFDASSSRHDPYCEREMQVWAKINAEKHGHPPVFRAPCIKNWHKKSHDMRRMPNGGYDWMVEWDQTVLSYFGKRHLYTQDPSEYEHMYDQGGNKYLGIQIYKEPEGYDKYISMTSCFVNPTAVTDGNFNMTVNAKGMEYTACPEQVPFNTFGLPMGKLHGPPNVCGAHIHGTKPSATPDLLRNPATCGAFVAGHWDNKPAGTDTWAEVSQGNLRCTYVTLQTGYPFSDATKQLGVHHDTQGNKKTCNTVTTWESPHVLEYSPSRSWDGYYFKSTFVKGSSAQPGYKYASIMNGENYRQCDLTIWYFKPLADKSTDPNQCVDMFIEYAGTDCISGWFDVNKHLANEHHAHMCKKGKCDVGSCTYEENSAAGHAWRENAITPRDPWAGYPIMINQRLMKIPNLCTGFDVKSSFTNFISIRHDAFGGKAQCALIQPMRTKARTLLI